MKKNALEWTVFAVSLALIALVVALLLHEHVTTGDRPAELHATVGAAVPSGEGFAVPVELRNTGDHTAEDVRVSVTLSGAGEESSDVTIPYVPYRSHRRAWVVFTRDPAAGRLAARVLGYREP